MFMNMLISSLLKPFVPRIKIKYTKLDSTMWYMGGAFGLHLLIISANFNR